MILKKLSNLNSSMNVLNFNDVLNGENPIIIPNEIKSDGTIYGKADNGNRSVPLYKIATANFHNPNGLYQIKDGKYVETADSGKPVIGRGEIRSGLLEMSNIDFKANIADYQQAKVQMELVNALIKSNKELLENAMQLVT